MPRFLESKRLDNAYLEIQNKCVCGHNVFMLKTTAKKMCDWCGRTVYNKNELGQKQKFMDNIKKFKIKEKKQKNGKVEL